MVGKQVEGLWGGMRAGWGRVSSASLFCAWMLGVEKRDRRQRKACGWGGAVLDLDSGLMSGSALCPWRPPEVGGLNWSVG